MRQAVILVDNPIGRRAWFTNGMYVVDQSEEISVAEEFDRVNAAAVSQMCVQALDTNLRSPKTETDRNLRQSSLNLYAEAFRNITNQLLQKKMIAYLWGSLQTEHAERVYEEQRQAAWTAPSAGPGTRNIYKRVDKANIAQETWWPTDASSSAILFSSGDSTAYQESLETALVAGDHENAFRLLFMPRCRLSLLAELATSGSIYVWATQSCMWLFYPTDTGLVDILSLVVKELISHDIKTFLGQGFDTIAYWCGTGSLPDDTIELRMPLGR